MARGGRVFLSDIRVHAARVFGVRECDISGRTRFAHIVRARQAVDYLARDLARLSFPQIGRAMGRDHSTVLHGRAKCIKRMQADPVYRALVRRTRKLVRRGKPLAIRQTPQDPKPALPMSAEAIAVERREERAAAQAVPETPWWERSDDDLLTERVQAYQAKGGSFVEVWP